MRINKGIVLCGLLFCSNGFALNWKWNSCKSKSPVSSVAPALTATTQNVAPASEDPAVASSEAGVVASAASIATPSVVAVGPASAATNQTRLYGWHHHGGSWHYHGWGWGYGSGYGYGGGFLCCY